MSHGDGSFGSLEMNRLFIFSQTAPVHASEGRAAHVATARFAEEEQLSEAVGIQSPNSPTMAPVGEDDPQGIIDSALAMEENTSEVAVLNQRLISLEQDNDMLRQRAKCFIALKDAKLFNENNNSFYVSVTETDNVPDLPVVTVGSEKTQVPDSDGSESHVATDSTVSAQESLEQCQSMLRELEKENKLLQEQCNAAEVEKTMLRTNIRKRRVSQQENRLLSVSDALHSTWLLVSDMKEQHAQLHASESILRYELKDKKELLHRLREELECSREQWHKIRKMNSESEEAWNSLREELNERRRKANEVVSPDSEGKEKEEIEGATAVVQPSDEFEPPVDLLLDMAIEYGIIDADDDASTAMVAAMEGEDMHASRLEDLEDQCSLAGNLSEEEGATAAGSADEAFTAMEEATDVEGDLSKRLINFLPKKIEILNQENKKLQERCRLLQEEKTASETHLTEMLEREQNLRRVLEAKLEHLGKIVDELKLERNGKVTCSDGCFV
ncbi:hypothetical protein E2C01_003923 [Portunus trituberculatus]|uniref:Uncharacterized protein n=1 Tax=Portunus trituberculatus TaxID=210409 RepID=A0A5B7CR16_PORTR|nr:hypothetical protein [Portunus trituberculatus]